jgi:hypothetical protein
MLDNTHARRLTRGERSLALLFVPGIDLILQNLS